MGWRDRDWAKFTDAERRVYLGGGRDAAGGARGRTTKPGRRSYSGSSGAWILAVLLALGAAVVVYPHVHDNRHVTALTLHPSLLPAPSRVAVRPVAPPTQLIRGTRLLQFGGKLTLTGHHTPMRGSVVVRGRWGSGGWETFGVANGERTTYTFRFPLTRRGALHIKIVYPDGAVAVGTYRVS